MKRLAFLAVVVALSLFPVRSRAQQVGPTGIQLQEECQAAIALEAKKEQTKGEYGKAAHCIGYVNGVSITLREWQRIDKQSARVCLPDKATTGEYLKVVLHYLDQHPNKLHMVYGVLILEALKDAYPCSAAH
jgi:hypothetical protein